ncbi:MAG: phosphatidylglycerophosphatase A family protein [Pseudomonadota bacterium]
MTTPASVWRNPVHFLAFGLGSGASPWAPGTAGTLAAAVIWWLLPPMTLTVYLLFLGLVCVVGVWLCDRTARDIGVHDHGGIVWDEFAGLWITLVLLPPGILWLGAGIVLFRFFDIIKPWPIGWLDRHVSGGIGIMVDDVLAGLMALACLQLAAQVIA